MDFGWGVAVGIGTNASGMLLNGFGWGVAVGIGMKVGWRMLRAINYCFEIGEIVSLVFFEFFYALHSIPRRGEASI